MPTCPKCGHQDPNLGAKCPFDEYYCIPDMGLKQFKRDPMIGTLAAEKYVILSLISEGGMGAVYRALQLPIKRKIAFKVLRSELKDSDQGRDRFIREAQAVAALQHPNIITLHDFGFDSTDYPYMVMEYAPGVSLADWLLNETVTLSRVLHVCEQLLSALCDAHDSGIVHRDLKPENLMIVKSGNDPDFVKLLDFGIARMINQNATKNLTREGEVFGTPHYMAPEQAQGKNDIGPPADVYAIGVMLFEMLTGAVPFDAPTPLAVLFQHINEPIPEVVSRSETRIPAAIVEVIHQAMSKETRDRYQSAGEMLKALQFANPAHGGSGVLQAIVGEVQTSSLGDSGATPLGVRTMGAGGASFRVTSSSELTGERVHAFDPDPSIERTVPRQAAESGLIEFESSAPNQGTRLLLIGLISVVTLGIVVMLGVAMTGGFDGNAEAVVAVPEPLEVEDKSAAIAAKEPKVPPTVAEKPVEKVISPEIPKVEEPEIPEVEKPVEKKVEKPVEKKVEKPVEKKVEKTKKTPKVKKVEVVATPDPKVEEVEPVEKKVKPAPWSTKAEEKKKKDPRLW